jgi:hypothetical protein
MGISESAEFTVVATKESKVLLIEVPMDF